MNTLQTTTLHEILLSWNKADSCIDQFLSDETCSSIEIENIQGGFHGFFTGHLLKQLNNRRRRALQYAQTGRFTQVSGAEEDPYNRDIVIIVSSEKDAADAATDIRTAFGDSAESGVSSVEIFQLPWWGMVPYRSAAKGAVVFGERAAVLAKLAEKNPPLSLSAKPRVFIIPQRAAQTPVPPASYIRSLLFSIRKGEKFDPSALADRLTVQGYIRVPRVSGRGEFALRGEVLDIFLPGEENAHRIVFDFDTVEHIKSFSSETQSSLESYDSLLVYPMKEIIWSDELIEQLSENLQEHRELKDKTEQLENGLLSELHIMRESEGEELFYPLVFEERTTVLDYIRPTVPVLFYDFDRLDNIQDNFNHEYTALYRKARSISPVPSPEDILIPFRTLIERHTRRIIFRTIHGNEQFANERIRFECDSARSFFGNINYLKEELNTLLNDKWKVFVYAESANQALRVKEILRDYTDNEKYINPLSVVPLPLSGGFGIPELKVLVIQENEIFGRRKHTPRSVKHAKSAVIDTFVELNTGDYVVHVNYGIGLFKGIERVRALGNERDYIKLEYADEETLFIPIEQVNLVQRYIGNEGDAPHLDRIGSKSWENRKNKVKKSVEDIAEKLIALYSKRKAARGFAFPKDAEWQTAFEAAFPYTETDDQLTVSAEIKADMEKPVPMDRLVCGDVGYGKTEMAMRAAFKAVMGGKQVAFLAPTTILAEQHYETCVERFENFPVKIAHMSRFVTKADQKKILERLAAGDVDILVGTHRIIQKDVIFKDLGLMIIDEEQRFGVKDKERLKELKTNIDSLAMSATPIPRTLHMSLLKIRDMSLLATPPQSRQPIETVIDAYNEDRVAAAIRREVERGGQIFYLHNRVESLDEIRLKLQRLVPEMMIDTAHGQMSAAELDDIFRRFKMGGFHVLVATTIIENGIDIPNVNTIIIDRADMYGVSQLYQLRGRVGRSDRKAYAYLLYPEGRALSEIAMKRLQVISDFTELGSGFKIAMKDMEIRGAGNLLGKDQSGDVFSVGFDLYLRLLEEAVQKLTQEQYEEQADVLLELEYTGFIPDTYIHIPQIKMEIYKKIAAVGTRDELERVFNELSDRFGPIPDEVSSLLALAEIRVMCRNLAVSALRERAGIARVEFSKVAKVSVDKILRLIKESSGAVKLDPKQPNVLLLATGKIGLKEKSEYIREKLERLGA